MQVPDFHIGNIITVQILSAFMNYKPFQRITPWRTKIRRLSQRTKLVLTSGF